jgi:hypothetical protein
METVPDEPGSAAVADEDQPPPPPVHYSTGRLTRAQAEVVNAWRARLREDRPLPGQPRAGEVARLILGADDRPRASCSDAVAAAVADLLTRRLPEPLALARYAYVGIQAQRAAAQGVGEDRAALYPPVSYYLPAELAGPAEELRALAFREARALYNELEAEAQRRLPGEDRAAAVARVVWLAGELARQGLPCLRQIPRGAIARMAIDQWARRGADRVAAAAVDYAASQHDQPHRARVDMQKIRR